MKKKENYELLRTQRDPLEFIKERVDPFEFLIIHFENPINTITTGMSPIRNMNHKRKYQLNRSQEYQLQYLLSKEESFQ